MSQPAPYGQQSGAVEYGLAGMEVEAVDSGLRSLLSVQWSLAVHAIHAIRRPPCPRAAQGQWCAGGALAYAARGILESVVTYEGAHQMHPGHRRASDGAGSLPPTARLARPDGEMCAQRRRPTHRLGA